MSTSFFLENVNWVVSREWNRIGHWKCYKTQQLGRGFLVLEMAGKILQKPELNPRTAEGE